MAGCPDYRLRLFLSADLAGSTAYKAGPGSARPQGEPQPAWVSKLRELYRGFPAIVAHEYERRRAARVGSELALSASGPKVWKTIGDEVVFCNRVISHQHLCDCIEAFSESLRVYGNTLETGGDGLDVKGAGWTAAFPAPNVTVLIDPNRPQSDQTTEDDELEAERLPRAADFLGNTIDIGFRAAKNAAPDQFVLSVELAYLIAEGVDRNMLLAKLNYHGRVILKGVLQDRAYPQVSIDVERSHRRRTLRRNEQRLTPSPEIDHRDLAVFLQSFMEDTKIELPCLPDAAMEEVHPRPQSYQDFVAAWELTDESNRLRNEAERQSAEEADTAVSTTFDADQQLSETLNQILPSPPM